MKEYIENIQAVIHRLNHKKDKVAAGKYPGLCSAERAQALTEFQKRFSILRFQI